MGKMYAGEGVPNGDGNRAPLVVVLLDLLHLLAQRDEVTAQHLLRFRG